MVKKLLRISLVGGVLLFAGRLATQAMEKELLRISEVGELTGLSRAMVYRLIATKSLGPVIHIGRAARLRTVDVRAWIDEQARAARSRGVA